MAKAFEALQRSPILPGKPFHKCFNRSREVDEIWSMFDKMKMTCETQKHLITTVYLIGPPGSGKTQLARQFGETFLKCMPESRPVVVTINVESVDSLLKSVKDLLHQLKLPLKIDPIADKCDAIEVARLYMDELRSVLSEYPGKWLLILDNLFSDKEFDGILPQGGCENWGDGQVIVTSQNGDLATASCYENAKTYSLRCGLKEQDAVELLVNVSGIQEDKFTSLLAKELEFFPLSLACSATYVSQMNADRPSSNFSWEQYLELHRKHKGMLKFRTFEKNVYSHSMVVAAQLAASRLAEYSEVLRHAFDFLSYCTISPIPLVIVSNFVHASLNGGIIEDTSAIIEDISAEVARCSLLTNSSYASSACENITPHQVMLQAFVQIRRERESNKEQTRKEYVRLLQCLQASLEKAIPHDDRSSVELKVLISPHLKSIISFGKAKKWTECAEFVAILVFLANCLYYVTGIKEDERASYAEQAYEISLRLPKPMKSIGYCYLLKTLGFYYREANHLDKAVSVLEEALRLTHAEDSEEWTKLTSSILSVLSWTYKLQKKFDKAEQMMKKSISFAKTLFGESHPAIITRLCDLAIIYRDKQDLSKAKKTVDQARELAESNMDQDLMRAQAANYSAKIYLRCAEMMDSSENRHDLLNDSLKLHSNALAIYEKVLGKNHIYVAGVCMTYAIVYKELQDYGRASEHVERAEDIYRETKHMQLSSALCYKTEILLHQCEANEAEKAIKESIGIENCDRARFLLSDVYLQQKRYRESKAIIQEVLARWRSGVLPSNFIWVKRAEKIKQQCDRQIIKILVTKFLLPMVVLFVAIFLGISYVNQ